MSFYSFLLLLSVPILSCFLNRIINLINKNQSNTKNALRAILITIVFTTIIISGIEKNVLAFFYSILCSVLFGHLYFQAFNLSETARRINIIVTLKKTGKLNVDSGYSPEQLVAIRLERIKDLNQVSIQEGYYASKPTVLTFAAVTLRRIERFMYPKRRTI